MAHQQNIGWALKKEYRWMQRGGDNGGEQRWKGHDRASALSIITISLQFDDGFCIGASRIMKATTAKRGYTI